MPPHFYSGCIYQCKDTNFKANHNFIAKDTATCLRCIYQCKDTNFKANHNRASLFQGLLQLYLPMQRY